MAYVLVEFTENSEVAVIPDAWLKEDGLFAYWPPYKSSSRVMAAVKQQEHPSSSWEPYRYKELYRSRESLSHSSNPNM